MQNSSEKWQIFNSNFKSARAANSAEYLFESAILKQNPCPENQLVGLTSNWYLRVNLSLKVGLTLFLMISVRPISFFSSPSFFE